MKPENLMIKDLMFSGLTCKYEDEDLESDEDFGYDEDLEYEVLEHNENCEWCEDDNN